MMKKLITSAFILTLSSATAQLNAKTWVGLDLGLGSSNYESASDNVDTSGVISLSLGYELTPRWGASISVLTGSGTSVAKENIGTATEADEELDFSAVSFNAYRNFALTPKQSIYLGLGINYNQTEVTLLGEATTDESGAGYTLNTGWQYDFGRWRMKAGVQRLGLSDVDINSANIGVVLEF